MYLALLFFVVVRAFRLGTIVLLLIAVVEIMRKELGSNKLSPEITFTQHGESSPSAPICIAYVEYNEIQ